MIFQLKAMGSRKFLQPALEPARLFDILTLSKRNIFGGVICASVVFENTRFAIHLHVFVHRKL